MLFGYSILATALLLSLTAAYYSVMGLTAIFSAATIPVLIMGASLELGKVVATVWLHNNWKKAPLLFKSYLVPAIAFLMLLTSMGIFGYLSKAHLDQNIPSGDAQSKVALYDDKIKTAHDNIEADKRALAQMDASVDQIMSRTTDDTGAARAANLRKSQARERANLQADIQRNQRDIAQFQNERAPLASEFRKIEAEVGPIKYVAALIYGGDGTDPAVLEKAVRFVIIMIVIVFDPLALCLILAANKQLEWARQERAERQQEPADQPLADGEPEGSPAPAYEADDGPLTAKQVTQLHKSVQLFPDFSHEDDLEEGNYRISAVDMSEPDTIEPTHMTDEDYRRAMSLFEPAPTPVQVVEELSDVVLVAEAAAVPVDLDEYTNPVPDMDDIYDDEYAGEEDAPMAQQDIATGWLWTNDPHPTVEEELLESAPESGLVVKEPESESVVDPLAHIVVPEIDLDDNLHRLAKTLYMAPRPDVDERTYYAQLQSGEIDRLPWHDEAHINDLPISDRERRHLIERFVNTQPATSRLKTTVDLGLQADNAPMQFAGEMRGFGSQFPAEPVKGDMFLRVDRLPTQLYKFNGQAWIEVDKELTDQHAYDDAYIDHLIEKIDSGEYDPELLSDSERDSIERRLNNRS